MRPRRRVGVGDMVLPTDDRDFLYSIPEKVESEDDPIDMIWENDTIGIVVDVQPVEPPQEYYQVKVVVAEAIGWTYSDYIKIIHR